MAKVALNKVLRKVEVIQENLEYSLTLTEDEGNFLIQLIGCHVAGGGKNRIIADHLFNVLQTAHSDYHGNVLPLHRLTENPTTLRLTD